MSKHFFIAIVGAAVVGTLLLGASLGFTLAENARMPGAFSDALNIFRADEPAGTMPGPMLAQQDAPDVADTPLELYRPVIDYENAVISAVQHADPAVVSIAITRELPIIERCPHDPFEGFRPPGFEDFFGGQPFQFYRDCPQGTERREVGGGTGFFVTSDGLLATNKHVVADDAAEYTVLTNDGNRHDARVIARHPVQDLAFLRVEGSGFPTIALGDSDSISMGQTAIAIGNALGEFRNTVSVGVVSGLSRSIIATGRSGGAERLEGLIQTDAAINRGNSGGPLLNLRGEVIGMNTAMAVGAQNIGFAIPVNVVVRSLEMVREAGEITVPFLGVRYTIITPGVQEREDLPVGYGALVRGGDDGPAVIPGSAAARAGIMAEDIILALNGERITAERSLASIIQKYRAGDTVTLTVLRNGQEIQLTATLEAREE